MRYITKIKVGNIRQLQMHFIQGETFPLASAVALDLERTL